MLRASRVHVRCAFHRPRSVAFRGFTLVEVMIVVAIIGLLAALAIPAFQRVQRASQNARAVNDFRVFSQAFESFNSLNGGWPPNAAAGMIPSGMSNDFKEDTWKTFPNVLGGRWNWDLDRAEFKAGVSISGFTVSDEQLLQIDAKLDDGDLTTGLFQKLGTRVTYILQPN